MRGFCFLILIFNVLTGVAQNNYSGLSFTQKDCDVSGISNDENHGLIKHEIKGKRNFLSFNVDGNCCEVLNPKIKISGDSIFIQTNNISEDYCWCDCIFQLEIKFQTEATVNNYFIDGFQDFSDINKREKYYREKKIEQDRLKIEIDSFHHNLFTLRLDEKRINYLGNYKLKYIYHDNYSLNGQRESDWSCEYGDTTLTGIDVYKNLIDKRSHTEIDSTVKGHLSNNKFLDSLFLNRQEHYNQIVTRKFNSLYSDVKVRDLKDLFSLIHGYKLLLSFEGKYLLMVRHFNSGSDPGYLYQEYYYYELVKQ